MLGLVLHGHAKVLSLRSWRRLQHMGTNAMVRSRSDQRDRELAFLLTPLKSDLARSGFLTQRSQLLAQRAYLTWIVLCIIFSMGWYTPRNFNVLAILTSAVVGIGTGVVLWRAWLKTRERRFDRQLRYSTPLVLENLLLLVESGFGILPAVHKLVEETQLRSEEQAPLLHLLHTAYRYSLHGFSFKSSLTNVAQSIEHRLVRHIFLHLELAESEGGSIVANLRALCDHCHREWKLSVEERVRRLENIAVFPIFLAVIGLMFLTAAVPLIPILSLRDSIRHPPTTATSWKSSSYE